MSAITKKYKLKSKTFSKKCIDEIKSLTQDIVGWRKIYVAGIGYTFYLHDVKGKTLAHCFKESGNMVLSVKL